MADVRVKVKDEFMEALMKKLGSKTYAEVVQEALTLLNWGVDESRAGRLILSTNDQGEDVARLAMPSLAAITPQHRNLARHG